MANQQPDSMIGRIRSLKVGEALIFPRDGMSIASIRNTATLVKDESGQTYTVNYKRFERKIIVTRIS